ncbi:hypothetical protein GOODEAATRI_022405 [Goodea atripinnis]|uniref:Telomerase reverse transcriptase n=1 Tax=Goodea atripinnis TaxID=208336 RepID=A0ABV0MU85_9TELE
MSAADMSAVLNILRSLYRHIKTLEEFVDCIVFSEGKRPVLVEQSDSNRFKAFVRGVFVCFDKELQQVPSCSQICTLPELLAFVLNTMKRKRRRNVLAHGYNLLALAQEDRNADHFKFQGDVTQSAAYVHGSDLWKKVTLRLGTDTTRYLLESCSIFVAVAPSCVFQVCGVPVYDRVSMSPSSSGFRLQPRFRKRSFSQFGRNQRSLTYCGRQEVQNLAESKIRRRKERVNKRKRKRGLDQLEEETVTFSGKRRRLANKESDQEQTVEERSARSFKPALSRRNVENGTTGFKQPVEMPTASLPLEGGLSWRSGVFPPLPPSQCFIRTLGLMYGNRGLHSFLLNRKKKSADGSRKLQGKDLVRIVFFEGLMYLNGLEKKPKKLSRRFFNMVPLFNRLLHQHKKCPYSKILQRICPLLEERNPGPTLNSLLPKHCAPHRVYLFVRECLSAVIPQELWGSDHNRIHFFARARGFLHSGKFERLSLAELMWNMKVNDCNWLKITGRIPPSELAYRTQILGQLLTWLLDGFVVGLVRACFYVTESVGQKNALRFYRQEVWAKLQDLAFKYTLRQSHTETRAASLPKGTVISRLRFIPKTDGMRPITRVIGTDPKTRVDVSGAYESLPHDKLIEVIGQALSPIQDELFTIRRYAKIWADSHEGLKKAFVRQADFLEDNMGSTNMKGFLMSLQKSGKLHHAILVEQDVPPVPRDSSGISRVQILLAGVPQYGLVVNPQKVAVNFQASGNVGSCPGIRVLPPHCLFPWCGLLLDTHSLDVYKDYSRALTTILPHSGFFPFSWTANEEEADGHS